ncbi:O-antigen translocase [Mariniflexile ostreae]|uniref:O-antigen translocase n=1 Tax=Mariniflexile ostreae TaxID=1520892 RepID=A0ABV5FEY3_9FLAO
MLKTWFNKLFQNPLLKIFSYNGVVVFVKLFTSFAVSKVSAIYLGPSGYAIVGNFKNLLQSILGITSSGFESGVIRYIAENKQDEKRLNTVVSSVIALSMTLSLVVALILIVFASPLADMVLKDQSLAFVFRYLALLIPLISLSFLFIYILNGLQKFKAYTLLITISNILNAIASFLLIYFYTLEGALMASILVPVLTLGASVFITEIRLVLKRAIFNIKVISLSFLKSISTYLVMAIYSTILISLSYLLIRNRVISSLDMHTAGLWEAMNKLSTFYMMFFSSLLTLYLLPQLALNTSIKGYNKIMKTYFKYLIPFMLVLFIGIYFSRILLIKLFLTDQFKSIEHFFYLQLTGDFVKVVAFSLAYQFHAKKMTISYFISDAILYLSFYGFSVYLINSFQLYGVFYAYVVSTILYLTSVSLFVFLKRTKYLKSDV